MSEHNQDPFNFNVNGEPATAENILLMESIAADILSSVPAEVRRRYSRSPSNQGAVAEFGTFIYEEEGAHDSHAYIAIHPPMEEDKEDEDYDCKIELAFKPDNQFDYLFIGMDSNLGVINQLIQDILETSDDLQPGDIEVLRCLQSIVHNSFGVDMIGKENFETPGQPGSDPQQHIADIIRNQVLTNTFYSIRSRILDQPLQADGMLVVVAYEVLDEKPLEDEIEIDLPSLQVEYVDNSNGVAFCYTKYRDDQITLEHNLISDLGDIELEEASAEALLIEEMQEELHDQIPRAADVSLLTSVMLEIALSGLNQPDYRNN